MTSISWNRLFQRLVVFFAQCLINLLVKLVRYLDIRIGVLHKPASLRPTRSFRIPSSKDKRRRIVVDVYEPVSRPSSSGPLPVHISFHGSAFVLPCHGSDAELCAYLANRLGCIVLDSDYAKGPRYPYPAAVDDATDVLAFVASKPDVFDVSKITVGGYSAGANIAILAALRVAKGASPVKGIVAWYAPTNMTKRGREEKTSPFASWLHRAFRSCYLPGGIDLMNPNVSPLYADSALFPPTTLIVGEDDPLLVDSVDLADKLIADGVDCVLHTIPGAGHVWERFVKKDTPLWAARERALELTEARLRQAYDN
ncbi:alpha/beta-hydrolase [Fomitiporia mediterranea MF3/22]|uniref:alpha/beta-hydrolase n=1 Tax=Fomitiporia mediterranea (strain MF3/22) TaxID=694068 RepID=UPI0004408D0F|nr:alpha/beta-hydrolase [Fomitiporia mediterranea MF3/22]EJC98799.1 alpha/beta-hydrolase [Fomitiporia mediterranea MF3/22]